MNTNIQTLTDLLRSSVEEWNTHRASTESGIILRGADLRGADLTHADLYGVDLQGADLRSAKIYLTMFSRADLRGADLRGADLRGMREMRSACFYGALCHGARIDIAGRVIIFMAGGIYK